MGTRAPCLVIVVFVTTSLLIFSLIVITVFNASVSVAKGLTLSTTTTILRNGATIVEGTASVSTPNFLHTFLLSTGFSQVSSG